MPKPIRAEDPREFKKLEKEVREYMERTPYPGIGRNLELDELILEPFNGSLRRAIAYLTEPDLRLDRIDSRWLHGLKHLGDAYGVRVVLHEKYYLK